MNLCWTRNIHLAREGTSSLRVTIPAEIGRIWLERGAKRVRITPLPTGAVLIEPITEEGAT